MALVVGAAAAAAGAAALRPRVAASRVAPPPVVEPAVAVIPEKPPRRLLTIVAAIVVAAAVAVPWAIPGFANRVGDWLAPASKPVPITIQDPSVLPQPTGAPTDAPAVAGPMAASGSPVQLIVPRLQVNAPVVPISGNSGELLPPSDPLMIGWWREGPKPGDAQGTALLTGHTVHYGGGAFDHLGSLTVGDRFRIRTAKGVITYVVQGVRKYTTGALARDAKALFRLTGAPGVLLITCANWNGHIYLDNTVVTGAPVSEVVS